MSVTVVHTLGDLDRDFRRLPDKAKAGISDVVRDVLREGNVIAKEFAVQSSGSHADEYPDSFTSEMYTATSGAYGPTLGGQGSLGLMENGTRKQPPHNNLLRSMDHLGEIERRHHEALYDWLFW